MSGSCGEGKVAQDRDRDIEKCEFPHCARVKKHEKISITDLGEQNSPLIQPLKNYQLNQDLQAVHLEQDHLLPVV